MIMVTQQLKTDPEAFKAKAREYVQKYVMELSYETIT